MRETNIDKPLHNIIIIIIIVQIFRHIFLLKPNFYSIMKNLALLLSLLFYTNSFAQVVKPFNLKDFEGKKIVSLFKSTTEIKSGFPDLPFAPTNQHHTVNRSISFQKKGENFLVQKVLSKVHIDIENMVTLEHDEFDTEKKFDRHEMATMVYGRYDSFINKPFKMIYNPQYSRIDTLSNFKYDNFYFETAWSDNVIPFLQENFLGFFQMSLPSETEWKVGQKWEQVIKRKEGPTTKNENIVNTYVVKSIKDNEITLAVSGVNIPEQSIYKRSDGYVNNTLKNNKMASTNKINYTIEQKATYEGIITLDAKNNFIQKLEISKNSYKKITLKDSPVSGPEEDFTITIENTLEDLK